MGVWRSFAIDHDIHIYRIGARPDGSRMTPQEAAAHSAKHYGDVTLKTVVLPLHDPADREGVRRVLESHGLAGALEVGENRVDFYNPEKGEYRTRSTPK
jgi:hypothetical protein